MKTGSWRNASNISSVPGLDSNQSGIPRLLSWVATPVWPFSSRIARATAKGNKIKIVGVAIVPTTSPVSNKPALVVLTEGKQRHGTPPAGTKEPVHFLPSPSARIGVLSLLTDEFPDKLRITGRRFGKVFNHKEHSGIAQETVGGAVDGLNGLRQRAEH